MRRRERETKKDIYGERKKELKSGITERAGEIKEKNKQKKQINGKRK